MSWYGDKNQPQWIWERDCTIRLTAGVLWSALAARLQLGARLSLSSESTLGSRRWTFIKAPDGLIERNLIERVAYEAVKIALEHEWMEGRWRHNCLKNEIIVKNSINMAKTINPYIQEDQLTPSPKHCGIWLLNWTNLAEAGFMNHTRL